MNRRTWMVAIALGVTTVAAGAGIASATGLTGDRDTPITGEALTRASEAALRHVGGGRVTGTEVGDEESRYEVEVTLPDGRQVDVQLDGDFTVLGTTTDREDEPR